MLSDETVKVAIEALEFHRKVTQDFAKITPSEVAAQLIPIDAALTELRQQPAMELVPNGTYRNEGSMIGVGSRDGQLSISQIKPRMNIWVGQLPPGWHLWRPRQGGVE